MIPLFIFGKKTDFGDGNSSCVTCYLFIFVMLHHFRMKRKTRNIHFDNIKHTFRQEIKERWEIGFWAYVNFVVIPIYKFKNVAITKLGYWGNCTHFTNTIAHLRSKIDRKMSKIHKLSLQFGGMTVHTSFSFSFQIWHFSRHGYMSNTHICKHWSDDNSIDLFSLPTHT